MKKLHKHIFIPRFFSWAFRRVIRYIIECARRREAIFFQNHFIQ
jgi:hypothetical protein